MDEFREESVELHRRSSSTATSEQWQLWGPSIPYSGTPTPCFRGGYLFRLYDEPTQTWAFYNDTFAFEMHCAFTFEKEVAVDVVSSRVVKETSETGECTYSIVIYPMETVEVMRAPRGRNRAVFDGKSLSKEYLARELSEAKAEVEAALQAVNTRTRSASAESVLKTCKQHGIPFVDPEFPPTAVSFEQSASLSSTPSSTATSTSSLSTNLKPSAWRRPENYLPLAWRDQLRLFRHDIVPNVVQRGELGDSWVISAIAALCENAKFVRDMFRHPANGSETAREENLGARRVTLNKDGMWHSTLVDTYLPMRGKQQRFARCASDFCEMWVSYLEKAYAKRNLSYGNIVSGDPLFALRDFTGFPTTRLDAKFRACRNDEAASAALFDRLAGDCDNGHQVLLSTPLSGETSMSSSELKEQGILVGYAYTVLEMRKIDSMTRLVRVRNPWASCTSWKGTWRAGSPEWSNNAKAAAAFPVHDGSNSSLIFSWEEVLTFFIGCGVVFNHYGYADYRIPSTFRGAKAQVCLQVNVTEPTHLTFILSQEDRRTRSDPEAGEYAPLVLSIAATFAGGPTSHPVAQLSTPVSVSSEEAVPRPAAQRMSVLTSSTADTEYPTTGLVYLQGRDVSIMHTFRPEHSPYLVIPRRLAREGDPAEMSFVLGVLSQLPFTTYGQAHLSLRCMREGSPFFENSASFDNDTTEVTLEYQVRKNGTPLSWCKSSQLNP